MKSEEIKVIVESYLCRELTKAEIELLAGVIFFAGGAKKCDFATAKGLITLIFLLMKEVKDLREDVSIYSNDSKELETLLKGCGDIGEAFYNLWVGRDLSPVERSIIIHGINRLELKKC